MAHLPKCHGTITPTANCSDSINSSGFYRILLFFPRLSGSLGRKAYYYDCQAQRGYTRKKFYLGQSILQHFCGQKWLLSKVWNEISLIIQWILSFQFTSLLYTTTKDVTFHFYQSRGLKPGIVTTLVNFGTFLCQFRTVQFALVRHVFFYKWTFKTQP